MHALPRRQMIEQSSIYGGRWTASDSEAVA